MKCTIVSTLHLVLKIDDNEKKKPEVIYIYNSTKYGVYILDLMERKYSIKSFLLEDGL